MRYGGRETSIEDGMCCRNGEKQYQRYRGVVDKTRRRNSNSLVVVQKGNVSISLHRPSVPGRHCILGLCGSTPSTHLVQLAPFRGLH